MTTWLVSHFPDSVDNLTQQMRVPLSKDAVLGFFGYICAPAHTCDQEDVHANDASSTPLLTSCIWGYRSALVDMYRSKQHELDPQLDRELRRVIDGYEKQLFIGTDNKNRFGRMLHRIIGSLSEEDKCILGCNPDDIGTHSLRKGSSSYALGQ
eukprot:jgi/Phyca11/70870/gw1.12.621.1